MGRGDLSRERGSRDLFIEWLLARFDLSARTESAIETQPNATWMEGSVEKGTRARGEARR